MHMSGKRGETTFYTITDDRFAPGTAALINSLRLHGHNERFVILDVGLRKDQRALFKRVAHLIPWDRKLATNPTLFKPFAHMDRPDGIVVIIDSDQVVTARLDEAIDAARDGAICAYPDPESGRWDAQWHEIFGLRGPLRHGVYVNAGFIAVSTRHWPDFLRRWWELCEQIWHVPTLYEPGEVGPASQADQDALNALLLSEVPDGAVHLLDVDRAPAAGALADGVEVVELAIPRGRYRGKGTALLHNAGKAKPWVRADWPFVRRTAYVRLLRRLLVGADLSIRLHQRDLPPWLRPGMVGAGTMLGLNAILSLAWRLGELPLIEPLARRVLRLLRR